MNRPTGTQRQSATYTADFRHEFEAETRHLLRERFLWFNALVGGVWVIMLLFRGWKIWSTLAKPPKDFVWTDQYRELIGSPLFELVALGTFAASFIAVRKGNLRGNDLLRLSFALVLVDGAVRIAMGALAVPGGWGLMGVVFAHTLACVLLPWSPRQAIGPMVPLLALSMIVAVFFGEGTVLGRVYGALWSLFAVVPGVTVSWIKHSRRLEQYRSRFFQRRYGELRRELVDARRIHESLFPRQIVHGPVTFKYRYEPMRQIGGDYLYASDCRSGVGEKLSVVVLDVTGHGIPAALTVNRLHGELERVFAENPDIGPGEVLKLLNRYVHLTLATHSVYVTALCMRVNCREPLLEYASGGHPPAFLRAVDGTIEELPSTSFVLGACADDDFDPDPQRRRFGPGDSLIAYTDGAIEARNRAGKMLGIVGLSRMLASLTPDKGQGWDELILRNVEQHRYGPPADDTLVIELRRSLTVA